MMRRMSSSIRPVLTSAANPRVKAAIALRDRRERDRTGLTLVDGASVITTQSCRSTSTMICPSTSRRFLPNSCSWA